MYFTPDLEINHNRPVFCSLTLEQYHDIDFNLQDESLHVDSEKYKCTYP